jgi:hypothetical protein
VSFVRTVAISANDHPRLLSRFLFVSLKRVKRVENTLADRFQPHQLVERLLRGRNHILRPCLAALHPPTAPHGLELCAFRTCVLHGLRFDRYNYELSMYATALCPPCTMQHLTHRTHLITLHTATPHTPYSSSQSGSLSRSAASSSVESLPLPLFPFMFTPPSL